MNLTDIQNNIHYTYKNNTDLNALFSQVEYKAYPVNSNDPDLKTAMEIIHVQMRMMRILQNMILLRMEQEQRILDVIACILNAPKNSDDNENLKDIRAELEILHREIRDLWSQV